MPAGLFTITWFIMNMNVIVELLLKSMINVHIHSQQIP